MFGKRGLAFLLLVGVVLPHPAYGAATIVIQNLDMAGEGFNDPTPIAPVGGNAGTTVGQQRLIAFQSAADIWGATLTSTQTIIIKATFDPLSCTATSAVLGGAVPLSVSRDFTGAPLAGHWYVAALANKITGTNLNPGEADIQAQFNSNLGNAGCLTGVFFYLGLDNNHGGNIDLVTELLHEFAHGLGFTTSTNGSTGAQFSGFPTIYDHFLLDTTTSKLWDAMTDAERMASAINTGNLVWSGANVTAAVPTVLPLGTPRLTVTAPASVAGNYLVGTASFGAVLSSPGVTAEVMPVVDTAPDLGFACTTLSALNAAAVNGKIALIDRGTCTFAEKTKIVQDAGAVAAIIINNVAGSPPPGMGGADPTITIPAVQITQVDGQTLRTALATRSRLHSGMSANVGIAAVRLGADASDRVLMFNPNPFSPASSIIHWDPSTFPNQLMEPAINGDLTHSVVPPADLSFRLLQDIGW